MTETKEKKRTPKRLGIDKLQNKVKERESAPDYKGVKYDHIKWDTLRYDDNHKRQVIDINTVDRDGNLDGGVRTIATSDLQHTKYSVETAKQIQRERNNVRRRAKRQDSPIKAKKVKSED